MPTIYRTETDELGLHGQMLRGPVLEAGVRDFDNWLRNKIKHEDHTPREAELLDEVRDMLYETAGNVWGD